MSDLFELKITEKTMKHLMDLKKSYEESMGCKYTDSEVIQDLVYNHVNLTDLFTDVLRTIYNAIDNDVNNLIHMGLEEEDIRFIEECMNMVKEYKGE